MLLYIVSCPRALRCVRWFEVKSFGSTMIMNLRRPSTHSSHNQDTDPNKWVRKGRGKCFGSGAARALTDGSIVLKKKWFPTYPSLRVLCAPFICPLENKIPSDIVSTGHLLVFPFFVLFGISPRIRLRQPALSTIMIRLPSCKAVP